MPARTRLDPEVIQPLLYSIPAAARRVDLSTRAVYNLIAAGELRTVKIGRRRMIADTELRALVRRHTA